jgi:hypothetical protein
MAKPRKIHLDGKQDKASARYSVVGVKAPTKSQDTSGPYNGVRPCTTRLFLNTSPGLMFHLPSPANLQRGVLRRLDSFLQPPTYSTSR